MQANQHKQNYSTVCFLLFIIYCLPTAFSASRVKKFDPVNKTGTTTALSACAHPNLKTTHMTHENYSPLDGFV